MSLFKAASRIFATREQRTAFDPGQNHQTPFETAFGQLFGDRSMTVEKVSGYPPVAQAVSMIAGDCASLPLNVYKRLPGGNREKVKQNHYAHHLVNLWGEPNEYSTAFDLWFDFYHDALIRGLGLLWIERSGPTPVGLHRLDPDAWRPLHVNGQRYWANYARQPIILNDVDVIHHSGVRLDGLHPTDIIRRFADTLHTGTSLQKFTSSFFGNGAHVGGILQIPQGAGKDAIENVTNSVNAKADHRNWFKTLILRDGFTWQKTTVDPQAAQITEMDETQARHVCRIYSIPPSRLALRDSVAYNSLEQEETRYYRSACGPHLIRVRSQCHRKLLRPIHADTHFIDYLIDAIQWTDASSKSTIANAGILSGWLTADDVRKWHNLPPMTSQERADQANQADQTNQNNRGQEDAD